VRNIPTRRADTGVRPYISYWAITCKNRD